MTTELKVIMFTDQVGSTPGMKGRTYEETRRVAADLSRLTADAAGRCRGEILKDTGDGYMIAFRSCPDAVSCGALIQRYVAEHNRATSANPRLQFELHIGIDAGEALVLDNGDLRANAANQAARVCGEGPAGQVYFTPIVAGLLNRREVIFKEAGLFNLKGVGEIMLYALEQWLEPFSETPNPFVWRDGITNADDFFGRGKEQRTLQDYLAKSQNCQVVGPRRIGKTSLLRQIERRAREWDACAAVAFADMQDPKFWTLKGWLRHISRQWNWDAPDGLADFSERLEDAITGGLRPVLCLDEFEEMAKRGAEFTEDFLLALRACGQQGLAIVTASRETLDKITDPRSKSSAFFNTFPLLRLGALTEPEAQDFVNYWRVGVAPFADEEKREIWGFARRHPLALQIACYHVLKTRETGDTSATALEEAREQARLMLPDGW